MDSRPFLIDFLGTLLLDIYRESRIANSPFQDGKRKTAASRKVSKELQTSAMKEWRANIKGELGEREGSRKGALLRWCKGIADGILKWASYLLA